MTKEDKKCLREHLTIIEQSMTVMKKLLGSDLPEQPLPKLTKAKEREKKYERYILGK